MKAEIYIVREVINKNKKLAASNPNFIEEPGIVIKTYLGKIRCKKLTFLKDATLIQSIKDAKCSGATVFITANFEDLIIDEVPATKKMFNKKLYEEDL